MRKIVATIIIVLFIFSMNLALNMQVTEYLRKVILNDDGTCGNMQTNPSKDS